MLISSKKLNKEQSERVNRLVGKPFSLFKRVISNKIILRSLSVDELSPKILSLLGSKEFTVKAKVEIRPNGIIMAISNVGSPCIWAIPYYQFYMYDRKMLSIHAQGNFINLKKDEKLAANMDFFKYLLAKKLEYDSKYPHVDSL